MESMGCAGWETVERLLPYLDHYLLDIKHMDSAKHKEYSWDSGLQHHLHRSTQPFKKQMVRMLRRTEQGF